MSEDIDVDVLVDQTVAERRTRRVYRKDIDVQRDFREMFLRNETGRRVLLDLFHMCNMGAPTTAVTSDPYKTYFSEGQRSIGMKIRRILNEDVPTERPTMQAQRPQPNEE